MSMVALASRFNKNCSWIMFLPEIPPDIGIIINSHVGMFTMFDQCSFHSSSKGINAFACENSRLGQVGVNMGGEVVH